LATNVQGRKFILDGWEVQYTIIPLFMQALIHNYDSLWRLNEISCTKKKIIASLISSNVHWIARSFEKWSKIFVDGIWHEILEYWIERGPRRRIPSTFKIRLLLWGTCIMNNFIVTNNFEYRKCCFQNKLLPTRSYVKLKDNSNGPEHFQLIIEQRTDEHALRKRAH
jgi:hypothetical protein